MRVLTRLAFVAALAAGFVTGCGPSRTPVEAGPETQVIHIGIGVEPATLDPQLSAGVSERRILSALFEGLVSPHPETLAPVPAVAERWEISEDGRTWRFYLREDASWSDGRPVTADDFVFGWRRALTPSLAAPYASSFFMIAGAEDYFRSVTDDFGSVGISAIGPRIFEVRLQNPVPYFLSLLYQPAFAPAPRHAIEAHGDPFLRTTDWTRPARIVSNGAFVLTEQVINSHVRVTRSETYWDRENVALAGAVFHATPDKAAEERAFRAGQLHVSDSVPPALIADYQRRADPALRMNPYLGTFYVFLNTREEPFDDPHFRQALSLALDRRSLVEDVLQGGQLPAYHWTPPDTAGYTASARLDEDPARASAYLATSGYRGKPPVVYLFNSSENQRLIAETLQAMWRENLGIEVVLENVEWRVYLDRRRTGDFAMARGSWIGDFLDPKTFLDLWTSESTRNWTGWSHPAYDRAMEQAATATSESGRFAWFDQAEAILLEELPIIPLYFYTSVYLVDATVVGWEANLLDLHPLKHVRLDP